MSASSPALPATTRRKVRELVIAVGVAALIGGLAATNLFGVWLANLIG
ncbi:MAG TPA: hypothetical protein PL137_12045 [Nocardioides sp.]|nr:hypothetical protein [Nocardioides sp.]